MISGIINDEVSVISRSRRLSETLIIPNITKSESNNCFIILYLQVISQFLRALDIALGNHALRAQPTGYSTVGF